MNAKERLAIRRHLGLDPEKYDAPISALTSDEMDKREAELQDKAEKMLDVAQREGRDLNSDEAAACDLATQLIRGLQHERQARKDSGDMSPRVPERWKDGEVARASSFGYEKRSWAKLLYEGRPRVEYKGDWDSLINDIVEKRTMATISGPSGGFIIPSPISPEIVNMVSEQSIFLDRVWKIPATSKTQTIPMWDSETRTEGPLGAFSASWQAEGAAANPVTPTLRIATVPIQKLSVYVDASREVAQDGVGFGRQVGNAMIQAVAYGIDAALISGSGVGCPLGVINSDSAVSVTRSSANLISTLDVLQMYSRLWPALSNDAIWLCSPAALPQILALQDPGSRYIFMPSSEGLSKAVPGFLLGKPLFVTEKCSNLGTKGDLILVAPSAYVLCMRQEIEIEQTSAAKWSQDLISFRVTCRFGGQPLMDAQIVPKTGGNNLSWAAILQ